MTDHLSAAWFSCWWQDWAFCKRSEHVVLFASEASIYSLFLRVNTRKLCLDLQKISCWLFPACSCFCLCAYDIILGRVLILILIFICLVIWTLCHVVTNSLISKILRPLWPLLLIGLESTFLPILVIYILNIHNAIYYNPFNQNILSTHESIYYLLKLISQILEVLNK